MTALLGAATTIRTSRHVCDLSSFGLVGPPLYLDNHGRFRIRRHDRHRLDSRPRSLSPAGTAAYGERPTSSVPPTRRLMPSALGSSERPANQRSIVVGMHRPPSGSPPFGLDTPNFAARRDARRG